VEANWTIVGIIAVYLILILGVTLYMSRGGSGMRDYFIGGMKIPFYVVGFSMSAATMSGWGFVGMPGMVYKHGWAFGAVIGGGAATGMMLSVYLLAKPMRKCAERFNTLTVPDLLYLRYKSSAMRIIAALGIIAGCIGYQSAQYKAFANMIQTIVPISYLPALFIGVFVLTIYTIFGGVKSVIWADFFSTIVMVFAALLGLFYGLKLVGGISSANETLTAFNPDFTRLWHLEGGPMTAMAFFSIFLVIGIGYLGQPHVMTKFYSVDKQAGLKWTSVCAIISFLLIITAYYTGIWQKVLELRGLTPVVASPDMAGPTFVVTQLPTFLAGITFAGVCAAIISTSGAFILVASSAIVRDILQNVVFKGKELDERKQMLWSRLATAFVIIITVSFSIHPIALVGWLGLAAWGIFAATLTTPLVVGLWWKRGTTPAAITSSLIGLVGGLSLFALKQLHLYPLKVDPLGLAFALSIVAYVIVSLCTKQTDNEYFPIGE
jgi:sodium/proline symporter